jgi:hypothetical protein
MRDAFGPPNFPRFCEAWVVMGRLGRSGALEVRRPLAGGVRRIVFCRFDLLDPLAGLHRDRYALTTIAQERQTRHASEEQYLASPAVGLYGVWLRELFICRQARAGPVLRLLRPLRAGDGHTLTLPARGGQLRASPPVRAGLKAKKLSSSASVIPSMSRT